MNEVQEDAAVAKKKLDRDALQASVMVSAAKIEARKIIEEAEGVAITKLQKKIPTLMERLEPADVFALVLVIGVIVANLIQIKQQFMIPQALLLICGYYFGRRIQKKLTHISKNN